MKKQCCALLAAQLFLTGPVAVFAADETTDAVVSTETQRDREAEKKVFLETLAKDGYAEIGDFKVEKMRDNG